MSEARLLGRVVRCSSQGWELEADQRHAERIIAELGLEAANSVATPCELVRGSEDDSDEPLRGAEITWYRALVARVNYLAQDRPDLQFASKEACRGMAAPSSHHLKALRRIGRYLVGAPRAVSKFHWQELQSTVEAFTDSDWAGCPKTGRSTSGGVLMLSLIHI